MLAWRPVAKQQSFPALISCALPDFFQNKNSENGRQSHLWNRLPITICSDLLRWSGRWRQFAKHLSYANGKQHSPSEMRRHLCASAQSNGAKYRSTLCMVNGRWHMCRNIKKLPVEALNSVWIFSHRLQIEDSTYIYVSSHLSFPLHLPDLK